MCSLTSGLVRIHLGFDTVEELDSWKPQWKEFDGVVCNIVDEYAMAFEADNSLSANDDVLKHSKLFIRDALTFWVFSDAIRYEDVGLMWLIYSFWLFMFRGAGCHNYGNEVLEMIAQFWYEKSESLRRIMERTWLVNRWGMLGRAIPTDLYLEHNNGFIKVLRLAVCVKKTDRILQRLFAALGSCASIAYIQNKCSGPVELLRKLSRDVATYFEVTDPNRRGSTVNAAADIRALVIDLKESQVHTLVPGRKIMQAGPKKGKGALDIFTEGKEVLEHGAFRDWKDRTGKFGADVSGCDAYQHKHGAVAGDHVTEDREGVPGDEEEILVEFDVEADLEMENEI